MDYGGLRGLVRLFHSVIESDTDGKLDDAERETLQNIVFERALRLIAAGERDPGSVATIALSVLAVDGLTLGEVLRGRG